MSALRVLYICHGHPELHPGGTEIFAHDLFRTVRSVGPVRPMFLGCVSPLHRSAHGTGRLQTLGRSADEMLLWVSDFDRLMLAQTEGQPFVRAMGELLTSFRPQIVHVHHLSRIGLEALLLVRRLVADARIVMTLHDYHPLCANDGLMLPTAEDAPCAGASPDACHRCLPSVPATRLRARQVHVQNLLGLVDHFIAPSRFLRDRFVEWGLPASRIEVIRNAVPAGTPPAGRDRRQPAKVFGFFGNIARHKGVLVALAAAQRLAAAGVDIELRLHGGLGFQTTAFRDAFTTALAATPVAQHRGAYRREQLPALMAAVDWVVVPSIWHENAPLTILEAFRHRRPVICSALGGMTELVHHDVNGLHVRPADAHDLAQALRHAATDPELWDRLTHHPTPVPDLNEAAERHLALYAGLAAHREALSA